MEKIKMEIIKPKNENGEFSDLSVLSDKNSIFLADPCPNYENDWRLDIFKKFEKAGFVGTLITPTNDQYDENNPDELEKQTNWELEAMNKASIIFFNLDRSQEHPGFTTNIEVGYWLGKESEKTLVFYCPEGNTMGSNRYIKIKAAQGKYPWLTDIDQAINFCTTFFDAVKEISDSEFDINNISITKEEASESVKCWFKRSNDSGDLYFDIQSMKFFNGNEMEINPTESEIYSLLLNPQTEILLENRINEEVQKERENKFSTITHNVVQEHIDYFNDKVKNLIEELNSKTGCLLGHKVDMYSVNISTSIAYGSVEISYSDSTTNVINFPGSFNLLFTPEFEKFRESVVTRYITVSLLKQSFMRSIISSGVYKKTLQDKAAQQLHNYLLNFSKQDTVYDSNS